MFFRNLTFFQFPAAVARDAIADGLQSAMHDAAAKPVGPLEQSSRGWVSPTGEGGELWLSIGMAIWITLGGEDRILPAAAINQELGKRIAEIEAREGRKLGGRARRRLKEDVVHELLPRALVKPYRLNAYIDLARGFIAIDTVSRKAAEALVSQLRHTLGSFPALPPNPELPVRTVLTEWLSQPRRLYSSMALGDEAVLREQADHGGVVRLQRHDLYLHDGEIAQHLQAGKQCTRLGLSCGDELAFTLGDDLVVRKLRFLDGALEALENSERDSLEAELAARFALMADFVGGLFDTLAEAFHFTKAEG